MDGLVVDLLDRVQNWPTTAREDVTGVRTGFIDMDKMTALACKGRPDHLAARPVDG